LPGYRARPATKALLADSGAASARSDSQRVRVPGFPFDTHEASERQAAAASLHGLPMERSIVLDDGLVLQLVLIPAGEFVMGNAQGSEDERPLSAVQIARPFWLGKFEVRNCEYARFDPTHDSGYISQHGTAVESRGYPVTGPGQPVVRVSWEDARAFCDWLSRKTSAKFSLPTEAQWEYACRAGTATALWYGGEQAIFTQFGNMADPKVEEMARRVPGKMLYSDNPDWVLRDNRSLDNALVTASVGSYLPNAWGLHDMHGNAAEWTRTTYRPYPSRADDGLDARTDECRTVVRGGSWYDRPKRCASGFRLSYPVWQAVYNFGFRVVCEAE